MRRFLRYAIVIAALCVAAYYMKDPDAARQNLADLTGRTGEVGERAPELVDEWDEAGGVKGQSASSAKRRLDSVRQRVGSSIEASEARLARHL